MFIETCESEIVNLAHVKSITRHDARGSYSRNDKVVFCKFMMASGDSISGHVPSDHTESWRLNEMAATIVPAQPGYQVIRFSIEDGKEWVDKHPVLAWRLTPGERDPAAVTPDNNDEDDNGNVLYPDGRVVNCWSGSFDSIEKWLEHQRQEHARHQELKKAREAA